MAKWRQHVISHLKTTPGLGSQIPKDSSESAGTDCCIRPWKVLAYNVYGHRIRSKGCRNVQCSRATCEQRTNQEAETQTADRETGTRTHVEILIKMADENKVKVLPMFDTLC